MLRRLLLAATATTAATEVLRLIIVRCDPAPPDPGRPATDEVSSSMTDRGLPSSRTPTAAAIAEAMVQAVSAVTRLTLAPVVDVVGAAEDMAPRPRLRAPACGFRRRIRRLAVTKIRQ